MSRYIKTHVLINKTSPIDLDYKALVNVNLPIRAKTQRIPSSMHILYSSHPVSFDEAIHENEVLNEAVLPAI